MYSLTVLPKMCCSNYNHTNLFLIKGVKKKSM